MAEEIEAKWLNIDPEKLEAKLVALGAEKIFDQLYRIQTMDYPDFRLDAAASWVRVRDEGSQVTMCFKQRMRNGNDKSGKTNDLGMVEHEVVVSDFDTARDFLYSIGLVNKYYEEKKRIRYIYQGIEFDIDLMPGVPPYLEIEASSWDDIEKGAKLLGLANEDKKIFSAYQVYALNGIEMRDYSEFRFSGLVKRQKK